MYIVIKRDKAEEHNEKLHKMKKFFCEMIEEFEDVMARAYDAEEYHRERSRRGLEPDHYRHEDRWEDHEMSRGRGGYGGRGRY